MIKFGLLPGGEISWLEFKNGIKKMGLPMGPKSMGQIWHNLSKDQDESCKIEDRTVNLSVFKNKVLGIKSSSEVTQSRPKSTCLIHGPTSAVASVARPVTACGQTGDKKAKGMLSIGSGAKAKDARDALVVTNRSCKPQIAHSRPNSACARPSSAPQMPLGKNKKPQISLLSWRFHNPRGAHPTKAAFETSKPK